MKLGFSQSEIITTAKSLGLPTDGFVQRRVARAIDILDSNKVSQIDDGIFRVRSQYDENKSYIVNVNHGQPYCDCPDGERTINCKHRIASLLYLRQAQAKALTIYDDSHNSYLGRGRWIVTDYKRKAKYIVYRDKYGRLHCPCPNGKRDCEHKKAIRDYENGNDTKRIVNDCGSAKAKALQDKMNGQLKKSGNNGNGDAKSPSQQPQLDLSDPFQESEQNDIDQIEGRKNGELAWKLSNSEYVISYRGIMTLAEKHGVRFTHGSNSNTKQVIARARLNGNERLSGKLPIPSKETAVELAKRNAARQLLPLGEIKAIEKKAQLEAKFSWQDAKAKCVEIVGTDANVDIIIYHLVNDGKLRQDNPSHYNRTEWLIIHDACKQDAQSNDDNNDGGGPKPSSSNDDWKAKLKECEQSALNANRFYWIRDELQREGTISKEHAKDWQDNDFELLKTAAAFDASLFNRPLCDDWVIIKERNWGTRGWIEGRMNRFWIMPRGSRIQYVRCFVCGKNKDEVSSLSSALVSFERYEIRTPICDDCLKDTTEKEVRAKVREMYNDGKNAVDTEGLPKPAEDFWKRIDDALNKREGNDTPSERTPNNADDDDSVEALDQPMEGDNGKKLEKLYDGKPITFEIDTDNPNKVTLTYPNGQVTKVHDNVMYESVLRST